MALIKPEQLRSGSYTISGSFSGSFQGDGSGITGIGAGFPFVGDAQITGSLDINGTGGDIFLVKSSSFEVLSVEESGIVTITNDAPTMFLIRDTSFAPIVAVSQSGVVIFSTQSTELTDPAPNGAIYFTSASFYVGLD
jgi:hypothetical protein|tara:strand:+ start:34 stop:447 length:414 start_codon:yes stop_codon:yes gene_type:complete